MTLAPDQFATFFLEVHGYAPFPWQTALLAKVLDGGWPDLLDLPTGSGKTSALDVAVFALALDGARFPRRTLLVVDRRVIVSQAAAHAEKLQCAVAKRATPVTRAVHDALLRLQGGEGAEPLLVAELRGGTVRDDAWAKRPDAALLGASTVDQVGSRLLFRGYGVGKKSASIHAGLLGHDTLLLLDEVHLSEPFRQTLAAVQTHFRTAVPGLPDRWKVVEMSATASSKRGRVHTLEQDDWDTGELKDRLTAKKPAALREVTVKGSNGLEQVAAEAAKEARGQLARGRRRVLVVVNRVDGARAVARALRSADAVVSLVTGRMRPWDRDAWAADVAPYLQFEKASDGPPRVVVSTQCIEAGADFDFDGLVTEGASLDALRQRFGRLNRRGKYAATDAVVLMRSDLLADSTKDPLYGAAANATWAWLRGREAGEGVDFGIEAMVGPLKLLDGGLKELVAAKKDAPILLPGHLDLWARTSQRPHYDPDLGPFLHGPEGGQPEVTLVWRADLVDGQPDEQVKGSLTAVPPTSAEGLSVPISAARAWLGGRPPVQVGDVPIQAPDDDEEVDEAGKAWRWSTDDDARWVDAREIRPGDVLVVPADRGGLWEANWDPTAKEPVNDLGDVAQEKVRGWWVRRLHPDVSGVSVPVEVGPDSDDYPDGLFEWLNADPERRLGRAVVNPATVRVIDTGAALILRAKKRRQGTEGDDWSTGDGDDRASYLGVEVTLDQHLTDVERWAKKLAHNLGLGAELEADLAFAGRLHDLGKADPRFQAMLQGGVAINPRLLAKSADGGADRAATRRAAKRSKYPPGTRHELLSVALVQDDPALRGLAHDWDLVMHLVASHHGWCRPFAPAVADDGPRAVTVTVPRGSELSGTTENTLASLASPVADRFHGAQRKYGWWGLAWLEAILRLADHRASEEREAAKEVERG